MVAWAIQAASKTPRLGFQVGPEPFANTARKGKVRSPANDCRMRGAPRKEAIAEDKVAAITPAVTRKSIKATFFMAP